MKLRLELNLRSGDCEGIVLHSSAMETKWKPPIEANVGATPRLVQLVVASAAVSVDTQNKYCMALTGT